MTVRVYLDHNATSPLRPEALRAVQEALARVGNPSSVHAEGRAARACLGRARKDVAALVGAEPDAVTFTSGGTEANNMALRPGALVGPGAHEPSRLFAGATEHASVGEGHGFPAEAVTLLPVGRDGLLDLGALACALDGPGGPALVSVQVANSETGVVQPVREIAALVHAKGGVLHADAVQAAGRIPLDLTDLGLDALTISGHKLGGPMGSGALIVAPGRAGERLRLLGGGAQEDRRRAGTENVAAIAGFGVAAACAARDLPVEAARLATLRDLAERAVRGAAPDACIFGEAATRLPNTLAFSVPGLSAETALMSLDLDGVAVSSGSACSSGKVGRSHVLAAMGIADEAARGAVRVSFGWNSSAADVSTFARAFEKLAERLYERERARAA